MSDDKERISVDTFDRIAEEQFTNEDVFKWFDIEVKVKKTLDLADMMAFVHDASEMCFSESGEFMPEVFDFAIKSNILTRYANFSLPDAEHSYRLIYGTDAVDMVCSHINEEQITEIINAVNSRIRYACNAGVAAIRHEISNFISAIDGMQDKMSDVFKNVSSEDVHKLIEATAGNRFDEEKLVAAYMSQSKSATM